MPAAFTAVGAFIAQVAVGAGIATGIASATIIGTIGAVVVFAGGAYLLTSLLTPKPRNPNRGAEAQAVINQATGPRVRIYGRAKVGGTRAFFDSKNGHLYQIVMLASHEIDAIEEYWIGDMEVTLDGDGLVQEELFTKYSESSKVQFKALKLGTDDQTAAEFLTGVFTEWTSDHRLRGIAYVGAIFVNTDVEHFNEVFPQTYNTPIRCVVRGAKVYDPRELDHDPDDASTWEWSDNPALCILDYLTHADGMHKPVSRIDVDSFEAFADICDEDVTLAAGGTESRYRIGGTIVLTEDPVDVLQRMLATCDGDLYQTNEGKIAIRGGEWEAPTVTITDDQILAIGELSEGSDAFSAFNELKIIYTSPDHDYQPQEAEPWADTTEQAEHGAIVEDLVLDMVQSPSQARRLAKIYMHKQNPELRGSIVTKLSGLDVLGERTVDCTIAELSVSDSFLVNGFTLRSDLTGCEISISSITAAAYEWDPETEEGENPPPPQDTAPDLELPVPQNVSLSISGSSTVVAVVDDPDRSDLVLEAQVKAGSGGTFEDMDVDGFSAESTTTISTGVTYYVRARWNRDGAVSDWSAEESITAP